MKPLLNWFSSLFSRRRRRAETNASRDALLAQLEVRTLEPRYVLNAAGGSSLLPPTGSTSSTSSISQPTNSTPSTTSNSNAPSLHASLDNNGNLVVRDQSGSAVDNQLQVRFDQQAGTLELYDPTQVFNTDIEGALGNGTSRLVISLASFTGEQIQIDTGAGNDYVSIDLGNGTLSKQLQLDGGTGIDTIELMGQHTSSIAYTLSDTSTSISISGPRDSSSIIAQLQLDDFEPIVDTLTSDSRSFVFVDASQVSYYGTNAPQNTAADSGLEQLAYSTSDGERTLSFAAPDENLSIDAQSEGASLRVSNFQLQLSNRLQLLAERGEISLDGDMQLTSGSLEASARDLTLRGDLSASDAPISLAASHTLEATSTSSITAMGGNVVLDGGDGEVLFSGKIDVSDREAGGLGGQVKVLGNEVSLLSGALIDASGSAGGGEVLIGGDYLGSNPEIRNANLTYMDADAAINASAIDNGNGGKIIIWADDTAIVAGSGNLKARGGELGGDGGFIETSGKRYLAILEAADAAAPRGTAGTWLLDPYNVTINGTGTAILTAGVHTATANNTEINVSTITTALAAGTNVTINTGNAGAQAGNITLANALTVNMGTNTATLTLNAANNVNINAAITANGTTGKLHVVLNSNTTAGGVNDDPTPAAGNVSITSNINTNGGNLTTSGVNLTSSGAIDTEGGNIVVNQTGTVGFTNSVVTSGGDFSSSGTTFSNSATGTISTGSGDVSITHSSTITIGANITTNTSGTATITSSAADIVFSGAVTLTTSTATLTATAGEITSGTGVDIDVSAANGTINLNAADAIGTTANEISVALGTGTINATTTGTGGDISITSAAALKLGSISTAAGSAQDVHIETTGGTSSHITLGASSTGNDDWAIVSTGNFTATGTFSITGNSIAVDAQSILSGGAGVDLIANSAGAAIKLTAASDIGATGDAFEISVPSGTISLTADTGDIALQLASGNLALSKITQLGLGGTNQIVTLSTADGDINVDNVLGLAGMAGDPTLNLTTQGTNRNINFTNASPLESAFINLTATGAVTATGAGPHVEVILGGGLTINADSIGANGASLHGNLNGAAVDLTATVGGVYFTETSGNFSTTDLTISVAGVGQTIYIATSNGDLTVADADDFNANTVDDNWQLRTTGTDDDIIFSVGILPMFVNTLNGTATGDILSTNDNVSVQAASAGIAITLSGANLGSDPDQAGFALRMRASDGLFSFTSAGDIFYATTDTNLDFSQFAVFNANGAGAEVYLRAENGDLSIDDLSSFTTISDDNVRLIADTGNVIFGTETLFGASVNITAGLQIISGSASVDIDTAGFDGDITLSANDGIGISPEGAISVAAGLGVVRASTTAADGDIAITSATALSLGNITTAVGEQTVSVSVTNDLLRITEATTTDDNIILFASGNIEFSGADHTLTATTVVMTSGANITTDGQDADIAVVGTVGTVLVVEAENIGATGLPIAVERPSNTNLSFTALDADVYIAFPDSAINFSNLQLSTGLSPTSVVSITSFGTITIDDFTNISTSTNDDAWELLTTEVTADILFTAAAPLVVGTIDAEAGGSILSTNSAVTIQASGTGTAVSLQGTNVGANPYVGGTPIRLDLDPSALLSIDAAGTIGISFVDGSWSASDFALLRNSAVAGSVFIGVENGDFTIDDTSTFDGTDDDSWTLDVDGVGFGNLMFGNATLVAGSIVVYTEGTVFSGSASVDFSTLNANGDITFFANGGVGSGSPVVIEAGTGIVRATTVDSGAGITIASMSELNVGQLTTNGASVENIGLYIFGGPNSINFVETSDTNDNWLMSSQADIALIDNVSLTGKTFDLLAVGAVVSGTANFDIRSTDNLTGVQIDAASIGSALNPFVLWQEYDALDVAATTGDLAIEVVEGDISLSNVGRFSAAGVGVDVYLKTRDGSIVVDVDGNTSDIFDDNLSFIAGGAGNNIELAAGTLTAASVYLEAGGALISYQNFPTLDIDTSASNGDITIITADGIGANGDPLDIDAGTGLVSLTTTGATGDIYVRGATQFNLGTITTAAGVQTIEIGTSSGDLTISDPSGSEDDWRLVASNGNIIFAGDGSLSANSANLYAFGSVTSDTAGIDIDTSASNGAIAIQAATGTIGIAGTRLEVNAGTGEYTLFAGSSMFIDFQGGQLLTSQFAAMNTNTFFATIDLLVSNGNLVIDDTSGLNANTTVSNMFLTTVPTFDILFTGDTLTTGAATLNSGGSILNNAAPGQPNLVSTVANIDLIAAGDIGADGSALFVRTTPGSATISADAGVNIYLQSDNAIRVEAMTTDVGTGNVELTSLNPNFDIVINTLINSDDNWVLVSARDVIIGVDGRLSANSVEIYADRDIVGDSTSLDIEVLSPGETIILVGDNVGQNGNNLNISLDPTAFLDITANAGDVFLTFETGDFLTSQIVNLDVIEASSFIQIIVNDGSLGLDSTAGFATSSNDDLFILIANATGATIDFTGNTTLIAQQAFLSAASAITSGGAVADIDTSAFSGAVTLTAIDAIGADNNHIAVNTGTGLTAGLVTVTTISDDGNVFLESPDTLRVFDITTSGGTAQQIGLSGGDIGGIILDGQLDSNDDWDIYSDGNIVFNGLAFLSGREVELVTADAVTSGTGVLDIDVTAAGGLLQISAATVGDPANHLEVNLGSSDLALYSNGGDFYINFHNTDLEASQFIGFGTTAEEVTFDLTVLDGEVRLDDFSNFSTELYDLNSTLIFRAQSTVGAANDVSITGGTLRAGSVQLESTGNIVGNVGPGIDIETRPEGIVRLVAIGEVDQNNMPVNGGQIGSPLNPMILKTSGVEAFSTGNQYYRAAPELRLLALDAGTGTIFLQAGTFYLDGFTDTTELGAGVVFGGNGFVNGNLNAPAAVTLAPGIGEGGTGQIIVMGYAFFGPGTEFVFDINTPYQLPGRDYDQLQVLSGADITGAILTLEGGEALQQSISDITLIEVMDPNSQVTGTFLLGEGSIGLDGKVSIGNFSSNIFYSGGTGNDVVLNNISLVPPIQNSNARPPVLRFLDFVRDAVVLPDTDVQPAQLNPVDPPIIEGDVDGVSVRKVQVRLLTPIDDEGNFLEEVVLTLDVEWLKNLSALFRRLPDDRYRLYLILEGGEQRRVMDVVIRDGRPFEPEENRDAEPPSSFVAPPAPVDSSTMPPEAAPPDAARSELAEIEATQTPTVEPTGQQPATPMLNAPTLNAPIQTAPLQSSGLDGSSNYFEQTAYIDQAHTPSMDEAIWSDDASTTASEQHTAAVRFVPASAGIAMVLASASSLGEWKNAVDQAVINHSQERLSRRGRLQARAKRKTRSAP